MSFSEPPSIAAVQAVARVASAAGLAIREERLRRGLTLKVVADRAGVSAATIHALESGDVTSVHTYARVATALGLRLSIVLEDPRKRGRSAVGRPVGLVHAAMGETEAAHLRALGYSVALDEPYQHYQFAGRADVLAWDLHAASLLHLENRTAFPDFQAAIGSYNAKRAYLPNDLARRLRLKGEWRSVTHVMVCLWSAELLRTMRGRRASLLAVCPDPTSAFEAWWSGGVPPIGIDSTLVLFDPTPGALSRPWLPFGDGRIDARYRDYAGAARSLTGRR